MKTPGGNHQESGARDAIRTAAVQLFANRGFAATTTREICEQARVTKPALYYHFGSKEGLFQSLIHDAHEECRKQMLQASHKGRSARERLVEVLAADFADTVRNPALSELFLRILFAPPSESPGVNVVELGMQWIELFAGILGDGVRRGEVKGKPREIAEALLGIHLIYSMGYLLVGRPKLDRALARRIVGLVFQGCEG